MGRDRDAGLSEDLTADVGDVRRRALVLHRQQPADLLDVVVGVALLAEGHADEHQGGPLGDHDLAVGDHLFCRTFGVDQRARRPALDLGLGPLELLVWVQLEDHAAAVGDLAGVLDEAFAVVRLERLATVGRTHQDVALVREVVVQILLAVVEVRDAGDDHLLRVEADVGEVLLVAIAAHAEALVALALASGGGASEPHRHLGEALRHAHQDVRRVEDALLAEDHRLAPDVGRHDLIGAGHEQVVAVADAHAPVVDLQVVLPQIVEAALRVLAAGDRDLGEAHPPHRFAVAGYVVGREPAVRVWQRHADLVHLGRLVLRPADEQHLLTPRDALRLGHHSLHFHAGSRAACSRSGPRTAPSRVSRPRRRRRRSPGPGRQQLG